MPGLLNSIFDGISDRLQEVHDRHLEEQTQHKKAEFDTLWSGLKNSASRIEELKAKGENATEDEKKEAQRLSQQWQWSYDALTKATKSNKQASGALQKVGQVVGKVLGHKQSKQAFDQGPQQAQQPPSQSTQLTADQQQGAQGPASKPPGMSVTDQQPAPQASAPAAQAKQAFNDGPSMQGAMAAADDTNVKAARARDDAKFKTDERIREDNAKSKNKIAEDAAKPAKSPGAKAEARAQLVKSYQEAFDLSPEDAEKKVAEEEAKQFGAKSQPKPSAAAQTRQQLVADHKALLLRDNPDMDPKEADKKAEYSVAEQEIKTAAKKSEVNTPASRLAQYLIDSGETTDPAEAKQRAAKTLADTQAAKLKASQDSNSVTLSPSELDALARLHFAIGENPSFGLSANNPNRVAYQKALANVVTGGMSNALSTRTNFKALQSALTGQQKMAANVSSFEKNAEKNIDQALELSPKVGRFGSSMVNDYLLRLQGKGEDYPDLARFTVAVDTAANEYARVVNSVTGGGVSTDSARADAHSLLNKAMAEGSFEAAAKQLKIEMNNRIQGIDETTEGIRAQIADLGNLDKPSAPSKPTPPPSSGRKVKVWNEKAQKFE